LEYKSLSEEKYFSDASKLVLGLGYVLVELRVFPMKEQVQVKAVITNSVENKEGIGINDCAKVHRVLLPRMEALLSNDNIYMEVTSPGMERTIKNAAEFEFFVGQMVRLWDIKKTDWVSGKILSSDSTQITLVMSDGENKSYPYEQIAKAKLLHI
jgi:ribosome maturation factor RimP